MIVTRAQNDGKTKSGARVAVVVRTRQKNRTGRPIAVVVSTVDIGYRFKTS